MIYNTKKDYALLDWDSKFFGFSVAIIHRYDLPISHLKDLLPVLKKKGVRLVYWPAAISNDFSIEKISNFNGLLVDKKTTFKISLDIFKTHFPCHPHVVERYNQSINFTNIEALAIQCGQHSRFAVDPKIPQTKFIELYNLWFEKSVTKQIADEVLIIRKDDYIQALISLKMKNSEAGEIGLLAVDKLFRNQKLGETLLSSALQWFQTFNIKYVTVTTQGENIAACRFYKKCGFFEEKAVNFFHIWI